MSPRSFGVEGITDEDRAYRGSRFSDVREALFAVELRCTHAATRTLAELASSLMVDVPRASGRRLRCRGEQPACSSRPRESGGWSR